MQFQLVRLPIWLPIRLPIGLRQSLGAALCGAAVALSGCSSTSSLREYVPQIVTPYRIDIQQGNFVTLDMVEKLQAGQTREQVRFILGTPLLTDVFHANRWDYVFRSAKGWNDPEKRRLTVFFDKAAHLEKWEAIDVPPPANLAQAQTDAGGGAAVTAAAQGAERPGVLGRLFGWMTPAAAAPAAPVPVAAAAQEAAKQAATDEAAKQAAAQGAAKQAAAQEAAAQEAAKQAAAQAAQQAAAQQAAAQQAAAQQAAAQQAAAQQAAAQQAAAQPRRSQRPVACAP